MISIQILLYYSFSICIALKYFKIKIEIKEYIEKRDSCKFSEFNLENFAV